VDIITWQLATMKVLHGTFMRQRVLVDVVSGRTRLLWLAGPH
jgi:hypothetical protein